MNGIMDKTIDSISTGHQALSFHDKSKEFDLAPSGTIGLDNAFLQALDVLTQTDSDEKLLIGRNNEFQSIKNS